MADVTYIPEGNNQANNILPWMLASQNGYGHREGGYYGERRDSMGRYRD